MKLVYGPHPIFKEKSQNVSKITTEIIDLSKCLEALLYSEGAVGVAAPMVGVLNRVISYDLQENDNKNPVKMINPEIIWTNDEKQTFEEGSICFPGVTLKIERPKQIKVKYLDIESNERELEAEGWLSTVIQHEIDYLDGKTIFGHLSPMKQKMAYKKTRKFQKEMNF